MFTVPSAETSKALQVSKEDNVLKVSKRANVRKKPTDIKRVFSHYVYNTHYVLYVMEQVNGKNVVGSEYELRDHKKLIRDYKCKLTNQKEMGPNAVVESILTHRVVDGRSLYLVQWEGFPSPVWNSEIFEDKLPPSCKHLLDEYKAMLKKYPVKM